MLHQLLGFLVASQCNDSAGILRNKLKHIDGVVDCTNLVANVNDSNFPKIQSKVELDDVSASTVNYSK